MSEPHSHSQIGWLERSETQQINAVGFHSAKPNLPAYDALGGWRRNRAKGF